MEHEPLTRSTRTKQVRPSTTRWICRQIRLLAGLDLNKSVTRLGRRCDRALERVARHERARG